MIRKTKAQIERMKVSLYCSKCKESIWFLPYKGSDKREGSVRECPTCHTKLKYKYTKEKKNDRN